MGIRSRICLAVVVASVCALLAVSTMPPLVQARPADELPPRPTYTLPPRPTPKATSTLTPSPEPPTQPNLQPKGAYIDLRVAPYQTGHWTLIQWKDALGDWHDVEGWQGTLDEGSHKFWWVAQDNLGEGPFRWLIFDALDGELLTTSATFHLPDTLDETVTVEVCLSPDADVCSAGE